MDGPGQPGPKPAGIAPARRHKHLGSAKDDHTTHCGREAGLTTEDDAVDDARHVGVLRPLFPQWAGSLLDCIQRYWRAYSGSRDQGLDSPQTEFRETCPRAGAGRCTRAGRGARNEGD